MTQLELSLAVETCLSCDGARWVDPHFSGMLDEPCPECCDVAWFRWLANPYGLLSIACCPRCGARDGYEAGCGWFRRCRMRGHAAFYRQPARVGQLGLGF